MIELATILLQRTLSAFGTTLLISNVRAMVAIGGKADEQQSFGPLVPAVPSTSDLDLLREGEGIVHLDPEIAYGAFDPRVPKQELHRT